MNHCVDVAPVLGAVECPALAKPPTVVTGQDTHTLTVSMHRGRVPAAVHSHM